MEKSKSFDSGRALPSNSNEIKFYLQYLSSDLTLGIAYTSVKEKPGCSEEKELQDRGKTKWGQGAREAHIKEAICLFSISHLMVTIEQKPHKQTHSLSPPLSLSRTDF